MLFLLYSFAIKNCYLNSLYLPGSRTDDWIKLKEFLTLDLAVLGLYETESSSKNEKLFSSMLVGTYNSKSGKFVWTPSKSQGNIQDVYYTFDVIATKGPQEDKEKNMV